MTLPDVLASPYRGRTGAPGGPMSTFPADRFTDAARAASDRFHTTIVHEVAAAVDRDPVVVVGMAWNPHVAGARKKLDDAGIPHTYLEYGSYVSMWKERLAIKLWTGWPTFPQVFVGGTFVGGNDDLGAALADGTVTALLAATTDA